MLLWLQISRLEQTWVTLRQRHTEGAILYEKKLKPFLKNLNDGKGETLFVCVCMCMLRKKNISSFITQQTRQHHLSSPA